MVADEYSGGKHHVLRVKRRFIKTFLNREVGSIIQKGNGIIVELKVVEFFQKY